jgi:hypothetical protein
LDAMESKRCRLRFKRVKRCKLRCKTIKRMQIKKQMNQKDANESKDAD